MQRSICASGLGLLGFGISLIVGLYVGNSFITLVMRAIAVMLLAYVFGYVVATLGQKVVEENFEAEAAELRAQAEADARERLEAIRSAEEQGDEEMIEVSSENPEMVGQNVP